MVEMHHFVLFIGLLFVPSTLEQLLADLPGKARWCVTSEAELKKCSDMRLTLRYQGLTPSLGCVVGRDKYGCMRQIERDEADLLTLDSGDVYIAGQQHSMISIMAEQYTGTNNKVRIIALVAANNDDIRSLPDLEGKKACFPSVGTSAWNVAVAKLINSTINRIDCNNYVKSAVDFFGDSCAPNALDDKHNLGFNPSKICKICKAPTRVDECTDHDHYAGEEGAFNCLSDGAGEVAFMQHITAISMTTGETQAGRRMEDFELLCEDGRRQPLGNYESCNWGTVPSNAVMTLSAKTPAEVAEYKNLLMQVQARFRPQTQGITSYVGVNQTGNSRDFRVFGSPWKYGKRNLMFSDAAIGLEDVGKRNNLRDYLGAYKTDIIDGLRSCPVAVMRWCVLSADEREKCDNMKRAFEAKLLRPELICVSAQSQVECMRFVRDGVADMVSLDGGEAYEAGIGFGMVPVVYEDYGSGDAAYYSVAVSLKQDKDTNLLKLRGKNSCHTGIGKTAGWIMPIGLLLALEQIRIDSRRDDTCDIAYAVGQFFEKSCVPGALAPEFDPKHRNPPNLCSLCRGTGGAFCKRDDSEPYYGYSGALRCLLEGFGDVAFVRHTTVAENTDGQSPGIWIRGTILDDFELLCLDGTRAHVQQWSTCNLGRVPSHVVMTQGGKSPQEIQTYIDLLMYGQQYFSSKQGDRFKMFVSPEGHHDLMFQDSTVRLQPVGERNTYDKYLGREFITAIENTLCISGSPSITSMSVLLFATALIVRLL
ncbi:PREDICTED: melanotransferrin-like [Priapulus caudatus]|uniref:Melanotransferrin-like n=1 Tax=Priapulus caudatus TaxID=37621 RepID=A0ABM1DUK7_PRICU|nr:PREDICTED: melanotransferrin-like [Priapulus caudatus]